MPTSPASPELPAKRLRVWDLPTRAFHWVLAACVTGLVITGTVGGDVMALHFRLGYAVLALVLFRISWGLVGGYWSRFSNFLYSPSSLLAYLRGERRAHHETGHSPSGALSVFALLAVLTAQVSSGLLSDDEIAFAGPLTRFVSNASVGLATNYHKHIGKWLLLALVLLHLLAIAYYWWRKQPLVKAMVTGDKLVPTGAQLPASRDDLRSRLLAVVLLVLCAAAACGVASLAAPAF